MTPAYHRFSVGAFECTALDDGSFNYPLESFFANVQRERLEEVLRRSELPTDHISTPYTCLLVDTGSQLVMVDTGAGSLGANASKFFPSVDHSTTVTGNLIRSLRAAGVEPGQVDVVIITHAHPDHIGGTLHDDGSLVFGNASYFIAREEWEYWMSDSALQGASAPMAAIARKALEPLHDRISLIEDGSEVVPGIRAVAAPGHTPGHLALSVQSAGQQLLHISDTALHPLHLEHPDWVPVFDVLPEQAHASKQRILDRSAREEALVFAHHFPPFPNLGRVTITGAGWLWHPQGGQGGAPPEAEGDTSRISSRQPA